MIWRCYVMILRGAFPLYNPHFNPLHYETMRLDKDAIDYFNVSSEESGIPYQTLINLYLRDCVSNERKLDLEWK